MAKKDTTPQFNVMSTHPDDFGTSRPDNFIATVTEELFALRPSSRKKEGDEYPRHHLYVNLTLEMEDGSEYKEPIFVTTILDMNDPKKINFAPSQDQIHLAGPEGANTVDDYIAYATGEAAFESEEEAEQYQGAYCVGFGTKIPPGAYWQLNETFKARLLEEGHDVEFLKSQRSDTMKGWTLQFARLDPDKRIAKEPKEGQQQQAFKILSVVDIIKAPKAGKKSASTAKDEAPAKTTAKSKAKPADDDDDENVEEILEKAIYSLLPKDNSSVTKKQIIADVLEKVGEEHSGEAMRLMNSKWLFSEDRRWYSNEDGSLQRSE